MSHLYDCLEPVDMVALSGDEPYRTGQLGQSLSQENDWENASLVLLGCNDYRGEGPGKKVQATREIREQLYRLYHWHHEISIADVGDIRPGAKLRDTYAAIEMVVGELISLGKKVLLIGGSHDLTMGLYRAFARREEVVEATVVDALIDIDPDSPIPSSKFLLDMLTSQPNYISQFNLLGFQSYYTYPGLLEAIDKLRFDCFRVGRVQEKMDEVEPVIRSSRMLSFDMKAMAHAYAPANRLSPNGFNGQEACKLMQYAGLNPDLQVAAILGPVSGDPLGLTAQQVSHMVWYFMDGMHKALHEASLEHREGFNEYHTLCAEVDTVFLQSRHTGRWWMQMPDKRFVPCSYSDYLAASHNDLPERWLRLQERM